MSVATGKSIRGDANVEMVLVIPPLSQFLAAFSVAVVAQHLEARKEFLELHLPI